MSIVYLGTDQVALAERLAASLEEEAREGDLFRPATIVVPNRYLGKWLRLWLARTRGVAINLRFPYLEAALWELLQEQDTRPRNQPLKLIDHEGYRLMVLSVLLESEAAALAPLRHYIGDVFLTGEGGRHAWRRAWHLADRLAGLIRDYEYHRQDALIQHWLRGELGFPRGDSAQLEAAQRDVFHEITKLPDGKRELLCRAGARHYKTLPQYAMEVMEFITTPAVAPEARRRIHLFGTTQISSLHLRTLHWLGDRYDLRLYHINPLVGQLDGSDLRSAPRARRSNPGDAGNELLRLWGQAGRESLALLGELVAGPFKVERVGAPPGGSRAPEGSRGRETQADPPTVLSCLQDHLLGRSAPETRRPQDTSLQIVACPGIYREVETVCNSILHNLQHTPDVRQTDIAVLVTDMARYRPVLQAVFDRHDKLLRYNLADYSAAGTSAYGQALLGFLDLALESFTRSRVLEVLLNPCFLAQLGLDRSQAAVWLTWAEELGVYHGWDTKERAERGYGDSPLFGWQLALRRLRLGRFMTSSASATDGDHPAPRFQGVLPYADLVSGDKEQLNAFCWAVEGLLPALVKLRGFRGSGSRWADQLHGLAQMFLEIPTDRPEEAQVRDKVLRVLAQFRTLDQLFASPPTLPLALIREMVQDNLEAIEGAKGEYLTGGVTISALQPLRPVPFRVMYVLGLGENFPGANLLPSFDLRGEGRCAGDIRPAEQNRFLFLESLLAARDKVYLLYTSNDLQRDEELFPCTPVRQLQRYLEKNVIARPGEADAKFETVSVPLSAFDLRYVTEGASAISDVVVNHGETERLMAVADARERGEVVLSRAVAKRLERRLEKSRTQHELPASAPAAPAERVPTVTLPELTRFLRCPAEASVRRHLRLTDEDEVELRDEEPFVTDRLQTTRLVGQALSGFVQRAVRDGAQEAVARWPERFSALFEEWQLGGRVPDGVFGDIERDGLERIVGDRLTGDGGLAAFFQEREERAFVGPVLLGESFAPIHPRTRFPALGLKLAKHESTLFGPKEARLIGSLPLVWRSTHAVEVLTVTTSSKELHPDALCRALLEPALFYFALRAGTEAMEGGMRSTDWLGKRDYKVHIAHPKGTVTYEYPAKAYSATKAHDYLATLAADLLDPDSFDLLPFDLIVKRDRLSQAYLAGDEDAALAHVRQGYKARLEQELAEDRESPYPDYYMPDVVALVNPAVPKDAFVKVRDRLRPLTEGLAPPRGADATPLAYPTPLANGSRRATKRKQQSGRKGGPRG